MIDRVISKTIDRVIFKIIDNLILIILVNISINEDKIRPEQKNFPYEQSTSQSHDTVNSSQFDNKYNTEKMTA